MRSSDVVTSIIASAKYRPICEQTVHDVVARELSRTASPKTAVRMAKQRLHRIWALYLGMPDFGRSEESLQAAFSSGRNENITSACRHILSQHRSANERLSIASDFYRGIFQVTGVPDAIHDLACALNPLMFRWMGLSADVRYYAYDINRRIVELINTYFRCEGLSQGAEHRDILCTPPVRSTHLGLLLKMYHCLERRRKGAGWQVLEEVPAEWMAVSFPNRSLAGRTVDIVGNYEGEIRERTAFRGWCCRRLDFETEIVLLIRKSKASR